MEVFDVVSNKDDKIVLKSEKQMESLFNEINKEQNVMIRWIETGEDEDGDEVEVKRSKLLVTEGLMARIKDGRFILEAKEATESSDDSDNE